jgi:hypothetical protein
MNLLNCPFCGSSAKSGVQFGEWDRIGCETPYLVFCTNEKCLIATKYCRTEEEAIKIWNTRSISKE